MACISVSAGDDIPAIVSRVGIDPDQPFGADGMPLYWFEDEGWLVFPGRDQAEVEKAAGVSKAARGRAKTKIDADRAKLIERAETEIAEAKQGIEWVNAVAAQVVADANVKTRGMGRKQAILAALADLDDSVSEEAVDRALAEVQIPYDSADAAQDAARAHRDLAANVIADAKARIG